jgi:hypothetical protein
MTSKFNEFLKLWAHMTVVGVVYVSLALVLAVLALLSMSLFGGILGGLLWVIGLFGFCAYVLTYWLE